MNLKENILHPFLLTLFAVFIYFSGINFQFTFLDDYVQVVENPYIKSFDFNSLKGIFSHFFVGMYQPLTTTFYTIVYSFFGLNPAAYHTLSLLFHIANGILVFKLLHSWLGSNKLSFILSLIFIAHPMQVESVAWISALSTLVFTFFTLLSCLFYLRYYSDKSNKNYLLCLLLFVLACLSKSSAVILPILLLGIDFLQHRKFELKALLEKAPFFIVSLLFGIITLVGRETAGHLSDLSVDFNLIDRIFLVSHSILFYPFKFLLPINLSAFYPYPELINNSLPISYYLSLPILLSMLALLIWQRKNHSLLFGMFWFFVGLILVLQLVPVGNQITTDRYIYLPMVGLLLIIGNFLKKLLSEKVLLILLLIPIILGIMSFSRTQIWENDETLWKSVIEVEPNVSQAYNNLGSYVLKQNKSKLAFGYFNQAIQIQPNYADAYSNRGNLYAQAGNSAAALNDFNIAIQLKPHADAFFNRANELSKQNKLQEAILDYSKSIDLAPKVDSYTNRAFAYLKLGQFEAAQKDLNIAIKIDVRYSRSYFLYGLLEQRLGNKNGACNYFSKASKLGEVNATAALQQYCL